MPPMMQRPQQQRPQCPACGGEPMRGSKKGSPTCPVCHGDMSTSPAGKQAMAQQAKMGAAKVQQAMQQRQRAMPQGARPGMGPQGAPMGGARPQIDPRQLLAMLAARQQQGGPR